MLTWMRRFIRRLRSRKEDQSIHTISGKRFWPLDARAEDVDIYDIAYSLSQKCRYNGHCRGLYTVAQHCVLASQNTHHPQWALMHDAAEAYLPDVSRPLKPELKGFTEIEDRLLRVIAPVFGLEMPFPKEVHRIDAQMLVTEWRDLMPKGTSPGKKYEHIEPLPFCIRVWDPEEAEEAFLLRFFELFHPGKYSHEQIHRSLATIRRDRFEG